MQGNTGSKEYGPKSGRIRHTEEFKREAVAQFAERGHSVTSVEKRIGMSSKSLYDWVKKFGDEPDTSAADALEIKRLKAEQRREHGGQANAG